MKSSGSLDLPSTEGVPVMIKAWKREERDLGWVHFRVSRVNAMLEWVLPCPFDEIRHGGNRQSN
jgi:hypothetical protein